MMWVPNALKLIKNVIPEMQNQTVYISQYPDLAWQSDVWDIIYKSKVLF